MTEQAVTEATSMEPPPPPPDEENEALLDASKTFTITVVGSILFCAAALFIILATRMG